MNKNAIFGAVLSAGLILGNTNSEAAKKEVAPVVKSVNTKTAKKVENVIENEEETLLSLEQISIEEIVDYSKSILNVIESKQRKIIYAIERYKKLGVDGYKTNKEKIEEGNNLLARYEDETFEIKTFLKGIKSGKYNQASANKAYRGFETENSKLLVTFAGLQRKMNFGDDESTSTALNKKN